jgi:serine/threonine protein kinase/Tfp pilus assembly protein PilF
MPENQPPFDETSTYHDPIQKLKPGSKVGSRYTIIRLIGSGGMGRVYLAQDSELGIEVALKVLRPDRLGDESTVDRFKNELLIARKVSHRNVVRIHDIGEAEGQKYLTMSFIDGKSLKEILKDNGALQPSKAEEIALQLCEAVAVAHEEGVVHRDLKPANILIDENSRVFVTDFGIARSSEFSGGTEAGNVIGTPAYLSPEQARGERVDARSDVYSIGLILYEMVVGELPFDAASVAKFRNTDPAGLDSKIKKERPELPAYYASVVKKCLNPEPNGRYQNARALFEDLRNKAVRRPAFRWKRIASVAAIAIVILLAALYFTRQWKPDSSVKQETSTSTTGPTRSIVILPFSNQTGNAELKWVESALADQLTTELSEGSRLRIISSDRIHQTLEDLKFSAKTIDSAEANELAEILDAEYMIQGTIVKAGNTLRADAKITSRLRPSEILYFKATGTKPEDVFAMTENLAQQIRSKLGSSAEPHTAKKFNVPVPALKSFHQANDKLHQGEYAESLALFEKALQASPEFLKPYLQQSFAYERLGKHEEAIQVLEKAMQNPSSDQKTYLMIRARHSVLTGDLDTAIQSYQSLTEKYPADSETLFQLGIAYEEKGDLKNAVNSLTKVVALDPNHPQAYFHLGKDTVLMGEAEKGIHQYLLKALAVQTQLNNEFGKADVLNAIGVAYERLGRYEDAIRHYNESIAIKERIGNKKGEAKSLSNVAKIYLFQGEYDKATQILNRTSKIFEELNDPAGRADILNQFGVMNEDQGKFDRALQYYKEAMQIRKVIGNDRLTAQSYDNVGQIYYLTGRYDDAEVYWEQALALRKKIGEESGVILSLQNMGFLQLDQGKLDQAMKSFLDALDQSRAIKYENAIAVSLGNLGTIYQHQGRYGAAVDSYNEAITILNKLEDKKGVAEYSRLLGSVLLDMNNTSQAEQKLYEALNLAKEIQSFEMQTDSELLLSRLQLLKGDTYQANDHLNEAEQIAKNYNYENGILKAQIVKGLILSNSSESSSVDILKLAEKKASSLRNVWMILEARYALATALLNDAQNAAAIHAAQSGLQSARTTGSLPYQYRFHSILGVAFKAEGEPKKARSHFQEAHASYDKIVKSLNSEQSALFKELSDVKEILKGLKETEITKS